jgi:hypothetical protein
MATSARVVAKSSSTIEEPLSLFLLDENLKI